MLQMLHTKTSNKICLFVLERSSSVFRVLAHRNVFDISTSQAPQSQTPFAPQQPQPGFNQAPPPMGAQQHDDPQLVSNNAPQVPSPQVPFSTEMNQQGPAYNDPGQQMSLDGQ